MGDSQFLNDQKIKRKRHRDQVGSDEEEDPDFLTKHEQSSKRQKLFNSTGDRIEPFHMKSEIKNGVITHSGEYKIKRERDKQIDLQEDDEVYEDDAWLKSMEGQ